MEKYLQRQTLTLEHDRNSRHQQTLILTQKSMLVRSAWTGPPALLAQPC